MVETTAAASSVVVQLRGVRKAYNLGLPMETEVLHGVRLEGGQDNLAGNLSGGKQQCVAVARARAMGPALLFADEPTGNPDIKCADEVFTLLRQFSTEHGTTVLLVTHNADRARRCE